MNGWNGWDGVRAWRFIRASRDYRKAWLRRVPPPGLPEPAPFPVRLQTAVDLAALEWGMHAWENPYAEDGPLAPFWARAAMPDGMVAPGAAPFARVAAAGNASLSGLRLGDGALILRIERNAAAAQVRIPDGAAFPEDGGLLLVREVAQIEDVWSGIPAPRSGRVRGDGDRELLSVLEGEAEGRSHREIAADIWGQARVDEEYYTDGLDALAHQAPAEEGEGDPEAVPRHGRSRLERPGAVSRSRFLAHPVLRFSPVGLACRTEAHGDRKPGS